MELKLIHPRHSDYQPSVESCLACNDEAQAKLTLGQVVDYIHTHSTAHYEREWQGDDFVAVDYLWLKREDFDQLRKLAE